MNADAQQTAQTPFQQYGGQFVAPVNSEQYAGINATNQYANAAQPYYGAATSYATGAYGSALPYYGTATGQVANASGLGAAANSNAYNTLSGAQQQGQAGLGAAVGAYGQGYNAAQPYTQASTAALAGGLGAAAPLNNAAVSGYAGAYQGAQPYNAAAASGYTGAYANAQPYNQAATQGIGAAANTGASYNAASAQGLGAALNSTQPYNAAAGAYDVGGGQAVNAQQIGQGQINQFESPYINDVTQSQLALLNQQNQAAQSGQTGTAIQSGAFGGDRTGIAAANLQQQQDLATNSILSNSLNSAYTQALGAAQQQQGVNLGAAQANRSALQQTGQALQGLGAAQYGQGTGTAQAIGALGNQAYSQGLGAATALQNVGQQQYEQGTGAATGLLNTGQQQFGQGTTTASGLGALGQQEYSQGLGAAGQLQSLGQQQYTQGEGLGSNLQSAANQGYTQGANTAAQQAAIGNQAFNQGITAAGENATLGSNLYNLGSETSQNLANLGTGAQSAGLAGAQAQQAAGATEQQTQQAQDTALYNQFLQQQSYPFQVDQFLANIAEGTGALSGSTTTTTQPGSLFSDERLKENIRHIGELKDGQKIYSYNYKGETTPRIGLIAQEVEKKHPEAVGQSHGYKTVDYGRATAEARALKAGGGGLSYDPQLAAELLQAQGSMYGPYGASGPGASPASGGLYGGMGAGRVPAANLPVHQLLKSDFQPQRQPSVLQNIATAGNAAKGTNELWDDGKKLWDSTGLGAATPQQDIGQYVNNDFHPDNLNTPPQIPTDDSDQGVNQDGKYSARGGFVGFANGGPVDPYGQMPGLGLDIPQGDGSTPTLQKPGGLGGGGGGQSNGLLGDISQLGSAAKGAEAIGQLGGEAAGATGDFFSQVLPMLMAFKNGGRAGRAEGGRTGYAGAGFVDPSQQDIGLDDGTSGDAISDDVNKKDHFLGPLFDGIVHYFGGLSPAEQKAQGVGPQAAGDYLNGQVNNRIAPSFRQAAGLASPPPAPQAPAATALGAAATPAPPRPSRGALGLAAAAHSAPLDLDALGSGAPSPGLSGVSTTPSAAPEPVGPTSLTNGFSGSPGVAPNMADAVPAGLTGGSSPAGAASTPASSAPHSNALGDAAHSLMDGAGGVLGHLGDAAKGYGDKLMSGDKDSWIPLLTGLAAFTGAPTRNFGTALAQGLGAGAASYMPLKKAEADVQNIQAHTGQTNLQSAMMARALGTQVINGITWVNFSDGSRMPFAKYMQLQNQPQLAGQAAMAASASGGNPAGQPPSAAAATSPGTPQNAPAPVAHPINGAPQAAQAPAGTMAQQATASLPQSHLDTHMLGQHSLANIQRDNDTLMALPEAARNAAVGEFGQYQSKIDEAAQDAHAMGASQSQLGSELGALPRAGPLAAGPLSAARLMWMNRVNDIARSVGVPENMLINQADLAHATAADKATNIMSFGRANGADQRSLGALEAAHSTFANTSMSAPAAAEVLAGSFVDKQQALDQQEHTKEYVQRGTADGNQFFTASGAQTAFNADHDQKEYMKDKAALAKSFNLVYKDGPQKGQSMLPDILSGKIPTAWVERLVQRPIGRYIANSGG